MLDLWDKQNIKVTSHVIGEAARKYQALAKDIANRDHEIAVHGTIWYSQCNLMYEQELKHVKDGVNTIIDKTELNFNN